MNQDQARKLWDNAFGFNTIHGDNNSRLRLAASLFWDDEYIHTPVLQAAFLHEWADALYPSTKQLTKSQPSPGYASGSASDSGPGGGDTLGTQASSQPCLGTIPEGEGQASGSRVPPPALTTATLPPALAATVGEATDAMRDEAGKPVEDIPFTDPLPLCGHDGCEFPHDPVARHGRMAWEHEYLPDGSPRRRIAKGYRGDSLAGPWKKADPSDLAAAKATRARRTPPAKDSDDRKNWLVAEIAKKGERSIAALCEMPVEELEGMLK